MNKMMYKIFRVYSKVIGPIIGPVFINQNEQSKQCWLAAMGMYETLDIMNVHRYYDT